MPLRHFSADAASVDPGLAGRRLPSPRRRLVAFALDVVLLFLPSLAAAVGAAALSLRLSDPAGWAALRSLVAREIPEDVAGRERVFADLGALLARVDAPGMPPEALAAFARGDRLAGGRALADVDFVFVLRLDDSAPRPGAGSVMVPIESFVPSMARGVAIFGVPALYFTLLTAGGRRTLGKRLLGLRVVRLDGSRLGLWESFERFGSYLAVPGTLGLGLLDLWLEPNRRLAHDRGAGTVVLDER